MPFEFFPSRYVESGDFFMFFGVENGKEKEGAVNFIFKIAGLKGAALGPTIVIREKYRGKILAKFYTQALLNQLEVHFPEWKCYELRGRIYFQHRRRSSKFEAWQGLYKVGTKMFNCGSRDEPRWVAAGLTQNPITGELP